MYMFRTSYVHLQEDYILHVTFIVHVAIYGTFRAHPSNLVDWLHKCMENLPYKATCTT